MQNSRPLISFTFDDFPSSALHNGGAILMEAGAKGTYYTSLGLMGAVAPTGQMFSEGDLRQLLAEGHELGCHTFSHCHAYNTPPVEFERSITENARVLRKLAPGAEFRTLSYPISGPNRETKALAGRHFACCRGGGQTYNARALDLNCVSAFFLEQSRNDLNAITQLIEETCGQCGWLVFATHDVSEDPTRFGCKPAFFKQIVQRSVDAGVEILTVSEALGAVCATNN